MAKKGTYRRITGKRFSLTVHGALKEQLEFLKKFFGQEKVTFAVVARESGKHNIHPHFQCYFETEQPCSPKTELAEGLGENFHVEVAKGTRTANVRYIYAVDKDYELGMIEFTKGDVEVPRGYSSSRADFIRNFLPRPFQKDVIDIIEGPEEPRTIYWYWEPVGNTGKTALGRYLHQTFGAIMVGGKSSDILHGLARVREITGQYPQVIVVDIQRSIKASENIYATIESVKDGIFFSGKYESAMVDGKLNPDVFVVSNSPPDVEMLSKDRWKIFEIDQNYVAHEKPWKEYVFN